MNYHVEILLSRAFDGAFAAEHAADLRKSGISDATIAHQLIRSVPPAMIPRLLGFDLPAIRSALLFPFRAPAGGFMDHIRVKVFPPLLKVMRKGEVRWIPEEDRAPDDVKHETVKYLQPRESGTRLYFVRSCLRGVLEGQEQGWVGECKKKTLALAQVGKAVIGMCGVEGWHAAGWRSLLPDFDGIRLADRVVELVPDGDFQTNAAVRRAMRQLGEALANRGARPR